MKPKDAETKRAARRQLIETRQACVLQCEGALDEAIAARDRALIEAHGDKRAGGLSYDELAVATGTNPTTRISKGRVIQIVQGKSRYSKAQLARRAEG